MTGPEPIPEADSRTTVVDGASVRYLDAGEGDGPPVVLLHGGGIDEALLSWRHALPALATDRRVVAPDWPGYGESDPPTETPLPEYYRNILRAAGRP